MKFYPLFSDEWLNQRSLGLSDEENNGTKFTTGQLGKMWRKSPTSYLSRPIHKARYASEFRKYPNDILSKCLD